MTDLIVTEVTVKRGDIGVRFDDTLTAAGFDFSGATVVFLLRNIRTGTTTVTGSATVDSAAVGTATVHYTTDSDDLATADDFYQEWEVTKAGNKLSFPSNGYNLVHVLEDLNPA